MAYSSVAAAARSAFASVVSRFTMRVFVAATTGGGAVGYQSKFIDMTQPGHDIAITEAGQVAIDEYEVELEAIGGPVWEDYTEKINQDGVFPMRPISSITTLYWHHTASSKTATWEAIAKANKDRGLGGLVYHIGVRNDGRIELLNPLERRTNHTAGRNGTGVSAVLVGNYDLYAMSPEMEASVHVVRRLIRSYGIKKEELHRDVKATACPGKHATEFLRKTMNQEWI